MYVFVSTFLFVPGKKNIWFNSFWKQISFQIIKGKKLLLSYKIYPQSLYEIVKPNQRKGWRNPEMEKILCYRGFQVAENQHRCRTSVTVGWKHRYVGLWSFTEGNHLDTSDERFISLWLSDLKTNAEF